LHEQHRDRGQDKFQSIVANIAQLGLKRPITVGYSEGTNGHATYLLGCGEGRLEAFKALGQTEIPAVIVDATKEELLLMSLVENLARRQHATVDLAKEIELLKDRGHTFAEIARTTALDQSYVRGIVKLLKKGEERLLMAVERHKIPLSVAFTIASSDDKDVQMALADAYEKNDLRGKALLTARRLVESRRTHGKGIRAGVKKANGESVNSDTLIQAYRDETTRQRMIIQRAKICETRLLFAVSAIKHLFENENFVNLLRAESLDSLPEYLAEQIHPEGE
jgi:ParB family chromosome partitioning protein